MFAATVACDGPLRVFRRATYSSARWITIDFAIYLIEIFSNLFIWREMQMQAATVGKTYFRLDFP